MDVTDTAFPTSERSRMRRLHERGSADKAAVHAVLDAGLIAHVGYVIDGQPYVTPTAFWRRGDTVYWHGSSASRMLRQTAAGIPACLTVTHLDGLVLARSGFHHSMNYRSAMLFGRARRVDDPAEKEASLRDFIERLFPGRADTLRANEAQEVKATMVLALAIEEATVKVRAGAPRDDEADHDLPIWAGIVPIRQELGAPLADPRLRPGTPIPEHVAAYAAGAPLDAMLAGLARGYVPA